MNTNPYRPPDDREASRSVPEPTLMGGLRFVAFVAALFGVIGGLLGMLLGVLLPSYYRTVFSAGGSPNFIAWQVGFGLGLTQGLICGVITGGLVYVAVAWYKSRKGQ